MPELQYAEMMPNMNDFLAHNLLLNLCQQSTPVHQL